MQSDFDSLTSLTPKSNQLLLSLLLLQAPSSHPPIYTYQKLQYPQKMDLKETDFTHHVSIHS